MDEDSADFFRALADRGHEPFLVTTSGTLRFDLTRGKSVVHWYVTVRNGDVEVTRSDAPADVVVSTDEDTFEAAAAGRLNAMSAVLRGEIDVVGNLGLVITFQRLFPGPPESRRAS